MYHLIYDGDCSFCSGFARWAREHGGKKIETVPFQDRLKVEQLAPGLDEVRLSASFHLVAPSGRILSGPDAVPELVRLSLPAGAFLAWLLLRTPGSKPVVLYIYKWISEHRW